MRFEAPRVEEADRKRGGFTLIEILLTIMIVGLILTALYQILTSTLRIRARVEDREDPFVIGPMILDLVERDVQGTYFTNFKDNAYFFGESRIVGGRDADRFDLVTTVDSRVLMGDDDMTRVRSDVTEVGYALRDNPEIDGYLELYRREDFFVDEDPFEGGRYRRIFDRVRDFEVVYLTSGVEEAEAGGGSSGDEGRSGRRDEPASGGEGSSRRNRSLFVEQDDWDSRTAKRLPDAMKIELTIGTQDPRTGEEFLYAFDRLIRFPLDSNFDMTSLPTLAEAGREAASEATGATEGVKGAERGASGRGGRQRGGAGAIFERSGGSRGGGTRGSSGGGGRSPF
jgi:prepilin-type N-terminal cleavage/methylation domain-containing protein